MTDTNLALAELLFPGITATPRALMEQFPPRALPDGAWVTRFAPSPTGFVHIGSIMTALVSRRAAHQTGGIFILRIEDTDKKREQDGSVDAIVASLSTYGLTPDEGIVQVQPEVERGAYGPYTQSERAPIYEAFVRDLVLRGLAYPCFATEAELDAIRKQQEAQRAKPGIYGPYSPWRDASLEAVRAKLEAGERPVLRLRAPYPSDARVTFVDAIKGPLDLPANDQDFVLLKSGNRLPTYHLAHMVDDVLMRVTHVIRGDEWLPSAPLHIQLHAYFDLPLPVYAHVAPIATMDGASRRKLSKRKDPEANVAYYEQAGYPVQAVTEYLLNLANSDFYDWRKANPTAPNAEFPVRLERMQVASPLFDLVKLNDVSKDVIATWPAESVHEQALAWARRFDVRLADVLAADPAYSLRVFNIERQTAAPRKDIVSWSDVERALGFFFDPLFERALAGPGYPWPAIDLASATPLLTGCLELSLGQTKDEWLAAMRELAQAVGFARDAKTFKQAPESYPGHFGDAMMILRVALTGKTNTPDLYEIMQIMGGERVQARLTQAIAALS